VCGACVCGVCGWVRYVERFPWRVKSRSVLTHNRSLLTHARSL
jgi:hypothetical protein